MHERFARRIEGRLTRLGRRVQRRLERQVGRLHIELTDAEAASRIV